jgi:threonine dehydrogenase-like Zn-dependent dehydrogenase
VRAVVCKHGELSVEDRPEPVAEEGQLLIEVLRCGICGSDLHARHHCDELADVATDVGYDGAMRSDQEVVLGHEFVGRLVERGLGCRGSVPTGADVVALPMLRRDGAVHPLGLSARAPGAYAERLAVEESMAFAVPNGLPPDIAVLTEPLAVALHAVRRSEIGKRTPAIVVGCGPIGLGVICMLKARGVREVVASDPSPGRRALAERCGADFVVDPSVDSPYAGRGRFESAPEAFDFLVGTMETLNRPRLPWWHFWRAAEAAGMRPKAPVVFECVGIPGVIDEIIGAAPIFSRVVVVGVCMGADRIRPAMAINKEIDLRFVLGYTPLEFRSTLHMLADGEVEASALVTGHVGLEGVDAAFSALGDPERHAKVLIDPARIDAQR